MEMRNCRRCGKLFTYTGVPICTNCVKQDEEDFKIVKEYVYDHPRCTMAEVSQETGVSVRKITKFLREGRLEAVNGMDFGLECESCGTSIKTGRFCTKCASRLEGQISGAITPSEPEKEMTKEVKEGRTVRNYTSDRF